MCYSLIIVSSSQSDHSFIEVSTVKTTCGTCSFRTSFQEQAIFANVGSLKLCEADSGRWISSPSGGTLKQPPMKTKKADPSDQHWST